MTSFSGINPIINYNQSFCGTGQTEDQTTKVVDNLKTSEFLSDIPTDKVGTTSTKVARKGVKYLWHKFTDYIANLFNKKSPETEQSPKYDYQA